MHSKVPSETMTDPDAVDEDLSVIEAQARAIVQAIRPDWSVVRIEDHGRGRPDFEIRSRTKGDYLGVLEVTSTTPAARASFDAALASLDWTTPTLARSWWVVMQTDDVSLKDLRRELPLILGEAPFAEAELMTRIDVIDYATPGLEAWHTQLARLGVSHLTPFASTGFVDEISRLFIRKTLTGGAVSASIVNDELAAHLFEQGNLNKLRQAGPGNLAEFFVWMPDSLGQLSMDLSTISPSVPNSWPTTPITLPSGVTGVWVASSRALWQCDTSGWTVLAYPHLERQ